MSSYRPEFTDQARGQLRAIPRPDAMRILYRLTALLADPYGLDTSQLVGRPARRLRIGDYRLIYTIEADRLILHVLHIGHRREVYR